jgi:hypothetical protein
MPGLFQCVPDGDELVISTPFVFPDGDTIRLSLLPGRDPGALVLTDYGDALSYLAGYGVMVDGGGRRDTLVNSYLTSAGAALHRDSIYSVLTDPADLPNRLMSIGQCMVRILELAHTTVTPVPVTFLDEVRTHMERLPVTVVPRARLRQLLGKKVPLPDFGVAKGATMTVIKTISGTTPTRIHAHINHAVRVFDLIKRARNWRRVTILDDTLDIWEREWLEQLSHHSKVLRFHEDREELDDYVTHTA